VEASDRPVMKISPGKISYPGPKQVYRFVRNGMFEHDCISLLTEPSPEGGIALLQPFIRSGRQVAELPSLQETQRRTSRALDGLPEVFHNIHHPAEARVELSAQLLETSRKLEETL
jgi:nicotinate phosphoribosyltransferase